MGSEGPRDDRHFAVGDRTWREAGTGAARSRELGQERELSDAKEFIGTTGDVRIDLTRGGEYERLLDEEIEHYSAIEVTPDLREGGVHAQDSWTYYFRSLERDLFHTSFHREVVTHANRFEAPRLLSLGCGYGGHDLLVSAQLRKPFQLIAVDLNPNITAEADRRARAAGLDIQFMPADLNFISIQPDSFDVIYAHASLHHVLNLEHLFDQIKAGLRDEGRLVVLDIIGKTQVLFWKENVELAASVLRSMPRRYRPMAWKRFWRRWWFDPYHVIARYEEPSVQVGMEGIRQEEIEDLLLQRFVPVMNFK